MIPVGIQTTASPIVTPVAPARNLGCPDPRNTPQILQLIHTRGAKLVRRGPCRGFPVFAGRTLQESKR
jgi:hypothetical protein